MVQIFDALSAKIENNMKKLYNLESLNKMIKHAPEKMKESFAEIANTGIDRGTIKDSLKEAIKEAKRSQ